MIGKEYPSPYKRAISFHIIYAAASGAIALWKDRFAELGRRILIKALGYIFIFCLYVYIMGGQITSCAKNDLGKALMYKKYTSKVPMLLVDWSGSMCKTLGFLTTKININNPLYKVNHPWILKLNAGVSFYLNDITKEPTFDHTYYTAYVTFMSQLKKSDVKYYEWKEDKLVRRNIDESTYPTILAIYSKTTHSFDMNYLNRNMIEASSDLFVKNPIDFDNTGYRINNKGEHYRDINCEYYFGMWGYNKNVIADNFIVTDMHPPINYIILKK